MKKRLHLIILLALVALTGFAQQPQTGDYIYVYEKDGSVQSFIRDEIVEMGYSNYDTLGVAHNEVVSQIITLGEEAYIIPLSDIDSISFVTPATVYQPGVIRIDQGLMEYVESSDSLTIYFAANTPTNLLPRVGDKLVTLEMNDKFEAGFAGVVKNVQGMMVECDDVDLEEIFVTYYNTTITNLVSEDEAGARTRGEGKEMEIKLPTLSWALGAEFSREIKEVDDLAWKVGLKGEVSLTPTFLVKVSTLINNGKQLSGHIKTNLQLQEVISLSGGIEWSKEFGIKVFKKPVAPLCFFYLKPGVFVKAGATLSFNWIWTQNFNSMFTFDCNSKRKEQPVRAKWKAEKPTNDFDFQTMLSGSFSWGFFFEAGVACVSEKFGKIAYHMEYGDEAVGNTILYNNDLKEASLDTKLYEFLKGRTVELNVYTGSTAQGKVFENQVDFPIGISAKYNVATYSVVPTFSNVTFERDGNNGQASAKVSGNCIIPVKTGFILSDKKNNKLDSWTTEKAYWNGGSEIATTFYGLEEDQEYVLNPKIDVFGFDLKANPPANMKADEFPVQIINFEQTDANYSEVKGYTFEGKGYYYKFNATTTVELDKDAEKIKDWGYIYHDIYNVDKKISCANLGSNPYADKRYAYYYNEPYRTVSLTAYVQYEGETDIKKGGTHTFAVKYGGCPDNNHPHMIDLGLPSGTKWACCNVGASYPESYGNFYAWGETTPKSEYYSSDYQYWVDKDGNGRLSLELDDNYNWVSNEFINIGDDIAGTNYDAATVNWGAPWRMPSMDQIRELVNKTSREFVTLKNVRGIKFRGQNGGFIFLPAAGSYIGDENRNTELRGFYWGSTIDPKTQAQSAVLFFYTEEAGNPLPGGFTHFERSEGFSVRPVAE